MPPSNAQVLLIRTSYATIRERASNFALLFYHRLMQQHPFTRALFPDDMTRQVEVFRETLDMVIEHLDDRITLDPVLAVLGDRHVGYGVEERHYTIVGDILIATFREILGDRFTPATEEAWATAYTSVADVMIHQAHRRRSALPYRNGA